jgi:hypothetical protein
MPPTQVVVPSPPQPKLLPRSFSWTRAWSFPPALRAPGTKLLALDSSAAPGVVTADARARRCHNPHGPRTSSALPAPARSGSPHRLTYLMIMAPSPTRTKTAGRGARSTCLASVSLTAVGSAADPVDRASHMVPTSHGPHVPHIARARRGVPAGARRGDARCARRRSTQAQQVKGLCCPGQY